MMTSENSSDDERAEMGKLLSMWRNESLTPMTSVVGFAKLLLEETPKIGSLTPEQRKFLEIIVSGAHRSKEWWEIAVTYTKFSYKLYPPETDPVSIYHILDVVRSQAIRSRYVSELDIRVPDNLPMVRGDFSWSMAIYNLILPEPYIQLRPPGHVFIPKITIKENENTLVVTLWTDFRSSLSNNTIDVAEVFYAGGYLSTAKVIVERFSELHVTLLSPGIEFEFAIPIWEI